MIFVTSFNVSFAIEFYVSKGTVNVSHRDLLMGPFDENGDFDVHSREFRRQRAMGMVCSHKQSWDCGMRSEVSLRGDGNALSL